MIRITLFGCWKAFQRLMQRKHQTAWRETWRVTIHFCPKTKEMRSSFRDTFKGEWDTVPKRRGYTANELYPVYTYKTVWWQQVEKTMLLNCRRSFGHSRLVKLSGNKSESSQPTEGVRFIDCNNQTIKHPQCNLRENRVWHAHWKAGWSQWKKWLMLFC